MRAKGRILVVDGNVDFAENVAEVLGEFGYDADHVSDVRDALALWNDYDCIVSEQTMPRMSGLELLGELRRSGSTVPLVILSSRADDSLRARALSAGALLVLSKAGFEQWACTLLNALQRLERARNGLFPRKTRPGPGYSPRMRQSDLERDVC